MKKSEKVVLVGGCFDVIHPGHIVFLEEAKRQGDELIVLLESDDKVKKLKGEGRPVFTQNERAKVLMALKPVDKVILLPNTDSEDEYDQIIMEIKPDIIALTSGDKGYHHQRAAKKVGAKIKYVTNMVGNYSTSRILAH